MFGLPAILVSVALFAPTAATKDISQPLITAEQSAKTVTAPPPPNVGAISRDSRYWSHLKGVIDPEVVRAASRVLPSLAMGQETTTFLNGKEYLFRAEPHYHPPEFVGGPTGWHKGVTVYQAM